jgi:hypothetical protein
VAVKKNIQWKENYLSGIKYIVLLLRVCAKRKFGFDLVVLD